MNEPLKKESKGYQKSNEDLRLGNLQFLGRKGKLETFFFAAVLLISFSSTTGAETNVVVALPPQLIYNLPFPAITICPETKAQKSVVNFTDAYLTFITDQAEGHFSDEEISYIEAMSQVCDSHIFEKFNLSTTPTSGSDFAGILSKIAVDDSLLFCKFRGKLEKCTSFFEETITDDGICSTFNMIPRNEMFTSDDSIASTWTPQFGYETEDFIVHPRRASSGSDVGFNIVLLQKSFDLDFICRGPVQGWKVKVHSPDEHPRMSTGFQRISLNSETSIVVKPEVNLNYGKAGSTCHSNSSKPLKYFNDYSHANCITECLSSFVFSECECVKFSMVHDDETKICNQHQTKCVSDAMKNFSKMSQSKNEFPCDCKPSCSRVSYNSKTYQAPFDFKKVFAAYNEDLDGEFPLSLMSRLVVYLEDDFYVATSYLAMNNTQVDDVDLSNESSSTFL